MIKKHKIKKEFCTSILTKRRKHFTNLEIDALFPYLTRKRKLLKNLKSQPISKESIETGEINDDTIFNFLKKEKMKTNFLKEMENNYRLREEQKLAEL